MSDNISRRDAIEVIHRWCYRFDSYTNDLLVQGIEKLPSTDRTGKWLKNKHWSSERWEVDYKCSECGYITIFTPKYVPFCPNCGADMRGGDSE